MPSVHDWKSAVAAGETRRGFTDWLECGAESTLPSARTASTFAPSAPDCLRLAPLPAIGFIIENQVTHRYWNEERSDWVDTTYEASIYADASFVPAASWTLPHFTVVDLSRTCAAERAARPHGWTTAKHAGTGVQVVLRKLSHGRTMQYPGWPHCCRAEGIMFE